MSLALNITNQIDYMKLISTTIKPIVTVTIDNSYSYIRGLTAPQERELKSQLSYVVGGRNAYFSRFGAKRKSLLDKKGSFPTGLLNRVEVWLILNRINHRLNDKRVVP